MDLSGRGASGSGILEHGGEVDDDNSRGEILAGWCMEHHEVARGRVVPVMHLVVDIADAIMFHHELIATLRMLTANDRSNDESFACEPVPQSGFDLVVDELGPTPHAIQNRCGNVLQNGIDDADPEFVAPLFGERNDDPEQEVGRRLLNVAELLERLEAPCDNLTTIEVDQLFELFDAHAIE